MRRVVLSFVAVALCPPLQTVSAQRLTIRPGQRISVRSSATRPDRIECIYAGTAGDTLYAQTLGGSRSLAIPLASITRLERPVRESNAVSGALIGAVIGGMLGIGAVSSLSGSIVEPSAGQSVGIIALFAAIGVLPGTVVGALLTSDSGHWEDVPLDRVRLGFAPQLGSSVVLGLSVRF